MARNQSFSYLIYIDDQPFCIIYGDEQDAKDLTKGKDARYEPMPTVMMQYGLERNGDA